jgi:hypothetical protein
MHENFQRHKESTATTELAIAAQERLDAVTAEVRKKFITAHQESPNAFDDEDIGKGVALTLQYDLNRCEDPGERRILEQALLWSKDIENIKIRQGFENTTKINNDRRRRS